MRYLPLAPYFHHCPQGFSLGDRWRTAKKFGLMIDLHSHILPGIDDGAADISVSLRMARAFVAHGVTTVACTPHILPGLFHNTGPQIRVAIEQLQQVLDQENIPLRLVTGADNHIVQDFVRGLSSGHLLSLADTRYVLVEPPHHVELPRIEELFFNIMASGYVPILTHPERLTWIKTSYSMFRRLAQRGVWMQITSGSLTGSFGRSPRYWAERMLDEGCVHILATDAHNMESRPPDLAAGREYAARRVGDTEAEHLVYTRPAGVLANVSPSSLPMPTPAVPFPEVVNNAHKKSHRRGEGRTGGHGGVRGFAERLQRIFR
jgi:protein-tyrosine phosphatase